MEGILTKLLSIIKEEITIVQNDKSVRKNNLNHWIRVTIMILRGGFIFPNVRAEDGDIVTEASDKQDKINKQ
jgi:hypothetical protein